MEAVKKALGDGVRLMVDVNQKLDVLGNIRQAQLLEDLDLVWYEEPVLADDIAACAEVARAIKIPVATGENNYTRFEFRELIERRAARYLMPDVCRANGFSETLKIGHLAAAHQIAVSPHVVHELSLQVAGALSNGFLVEFMDWMPADLFAEMPAMRGRRLPDPRPAGPRHGARARAPSGSTASTERGPQNTASGLAGEPVPPTTTSGATISMNSSRCSSTQARREGLEERVVHERDPVGEERGVHRPGDVVAHRQVIQHVPDEHAHVVVPQELEAGDVQAGPLVGAEPEGAPVGPLRVRGLPGLATRVDADRVARLERSPRARAMSSSSQPCTGRSSVTDGSRGGAARPASPRG